MTQLNRLKKLDKALESNLESIMAKGYTEKNNIKVTIAGETVELDYNADLHDGLKKFLTEQIKME